MPVFPVPVSHSKQVERRTLKKIGHGNIRVLIISLWLLTIIASNRGKSELSDYVLILFNPAILQEISDRASWLAVL